MFCHSLRSFLAVLGIIIPLVLLWLFLTCLYISSKFVKRHKLRICALYKYHYDDDELINSQKYWLPGAFGIDNCLFAPCL